MTVMHQRQRKTKDPCSKCFLHKERCICNLLFKVSTSTKLTLIVHYKELKRTTNTGRLAIEALTNSEMKVRGLQGETLSLASTFENLEYQPLLLFPSESSNELTSEYISHFQKPIHLIVPDGNWRQASKVASRHPELNAIPRVQISTPNKSLNHLRKESTSEGMATLQAIAAAFKIIEGDSISDHLMTIYNAKLNSTLKGRGYEQK